MKATILIRAGTAVVVLSILLLVGAYIFLIRPRLPRLDGAYDVASLNQEVTIRRDRSGIPHIYAADESDLYTAQCFVQAQDRLWQMDMTRRAGLGRLSEVVGIETIETDRLFRTLNFAQAALADYELVDERTREILRACANGVNAYIEQAADQLPLEFLLMGYRPEKWSPVDSIVVAKVVAWGLSANYRAEIVAAELAGVLGREGVQKILPDSSQSAAPSRPKPGDNQAIPELFGSHQSDVAYSSLLQRDQGSNAWVVGGTRTYSGKPILANDTHQSLAMPSLWYEVGLHVVDGSLDSVGGSLPGIPGVAIGHNRRIAWGVTNARPDVQDLFVETLNEAGDRYLFRGRWRAIESRTETIKVRGQHDLRFAVRATRHGPLINAERDAGAPAVALRFTGLDGRAMIRAPLKLSRARNWSEFLDAIKDWEVPAMHFVYADIEGNIGYKMSGAIPVRRSNESAGLFPANGTGGEHEWIGTIRFERLPENFNPDADLLVNANNRPDEAAGPEFFGRYYQPAYRFSRIVDRIRGMSNIAVEDFERLQSDVYSEFNLKLARVAADGVRDEDARTQHVLKLLRNWDGRMTADSVAASISEVLVVRIFYSIFEGRLTEEQIAKYLGLAGYAYFYLEELLDRPEHPAWRGERRRILSAAFGDTLQYLEERLGPEPADWKWGRLHTVSFRHPLGAIGVLAPIFNRGPYAAPGSWNTVNSGAYFLDAGYEMTIGPAYRMICDLNDWDRSVSSITTGQSGHPFSEYYDANLEDWRATRFHPLPFSAAAVREATVHLMTLNPDH